MAANSTNETVAKRLAAVECEIVKADELVDGYERSGRGGEVGVVDALDRSGRQESTVHTRTWSG